MRRFLISLFLVGCCNASTNERYERCIAICGNPSNVCNNLVLEDCVSVCVEYSTSEEVDAFQACAECYVAVQCDPRSYQTLCYPSCGF